MINAYVIQRNCLQCYVARKNTIFFLRNFLSGGRGSGNLAARVWQRCWLGVMICIWVFVQRIILIEEPSPAHSPAQPRQLYPELSNLLTHNHGNQELAGVGEGFQLS